MHAIRGVLESEMPAFRAAEIPRFSGRRKSETWGEAARQIVSGDPSSTTMILLIGYVCFIHAKSVAANASFLSPYTGMTTSTAGRASLDSPFVRGGNRYQAPCEFSKALDA